MASAMALSHDLQSPNAKCIYGIMTIDWFNNGRVNKNDREFGANDNDYVSVNVFFFG